MAYNRMCLVRSISKTREELERTSLLHQQSLSAVEAIRALLVKADDRLQDNPRRWRRIIDNLEQALIQTKAQATGYAQRIKELERQIDTGAPAQTVVVEDIEITIPSGGASVAERIMSLTVEELRNLTLDEVAALHQSMFECGAGLDDCGAMASPEEVKPEPLPQARKTALHQRMEQAQKRREELAANRIKSSSKSFAERRQLKLLERALAKISQRAFAHLDSEEIDTVLTYFSKLQKTEGLSGRELELKHMLSGILPEVEKQCSELRRRQAQQRSMRRY